jgi:membrane protease YdiL (CAAX protease family)
MAAAARTAATTPSLPRPWRAFAPAAEALAFWALILVYEWWIEPAAGLALRLVCLLLLGLVPILSLYLHRDPPGEIGLRLEGLGRSAREVGAATLGGALLIAVVVVVRQAPLRLEEFRYLPTYFIWGFLQQLALQAFVHRRLRQSLGRPRLAALLAALLFGSTHVPNPVLVPATILAGWIWCRLYTRTPNLWTLAASQAVLALLVLACLPAAWVHNLKVGPGYWDWR